MPIPEKHMYLAELCDTLSRRWPENRTVNLVCHGHSVPSGYACTPFVDAFHAYPHMMHRTLSQRFPYAVINVIVTAIGGENAVQGAARFQKEVLCHRPDLVTIDYGLNDRGLSLEQAEEAWRRMIEKALERKIPVILLTPSWDKTWFARSEEWHALEQHARQIRRLAEEYQVALADSFAAYGKEVQEHGDLLNLLSHWNHPSPLGHELIARELTAWFPAK